MNKIYINNLKKLDEYLQTQNTIECNLTNYVWLEYGFYPIFFNELFREFFTTLKGKYIGICFEGHELFYEKWVQDLVILEGFIDTTKTYKNNKETDLLISNFKKYSDRGIAFWYTLRNFDEDSYLSIINKYKFKNTLHPIGKDLPWKMGLFGCNVFKYATGERDFFTSKDTLWKTSKTLGWNLNYWNKNYNFPNIINIPNKEYYTIFVKNTWKSRTFRSKDINDFLVGDGTTGKQGYGFVDVKFYSKILEKFIKENKKLVIINDLVKYPIPKHPNIIEFNMIGSFDVSKFCSIVHNSKLFISSSTSPMDLAAYYCDTNMVLLDDRQNKYLWVQKVLDMKGKKTITFDMKNDNFDKLSSFIEKI